MMDKNKEANAVCLFIAAIVAVTMAVGYLINYLNAKGHDGTALGIFFLLLIMGLALALGADK